MSCRYALSAVSTILFSAFAIAGVPADPLITAPAVLPRQNDAQFIGWVEVSGTWYSETCNAGLTWYQDGKYGQCCPITLASCYAPTACANGQMVYPYSDVSSTRTIPCTEDFNNPLLSICNTVFIFENMSDSSPKTDIICGSSSVNWSYYREIPASATQISTDAPVSIAQVVSTADTAPETTAGTSPNSSSNSSSSKNGKKKSKSKAWIAGAVIGPILAAALIGAITTFLRKRKNKGAAPQQGSAAMAPVNPGQPPAGVGGFTDAKPQMAEPPQPYPNQSAYGAQQQNYPSPPLSPAQQFNGAALYNAPVSLPPQQFNGAAPYNAPVSPQPPQPYYGNEVKQAYMGAPMGGASELASSNGNAAPVAHTATNAHTAEFGGHAGAPEQSGPSELPTVSSPNRPAA